VSFLPILFSPPQFEGKCDLEGARISIIWHIWKKRSKVVFKDGKVDE